MIPVVIRFFTFDVISEHPMVYWGLGVAWLFLLIAAFSSLRIQSLTTGKKFLWFAFILLLPVVGLACYCVYCLIRGNWSFLKTLFAQPRVVKTVQSK